MRAVKFLFVIITLICVAASAPATAEECSGVELVQLKTADGVLLAGVWRRGQASVQKAGVVMVHGYSGNFYSSVRTFLPEALSDRGFHTLAINMRDHDRVPKKNLFEENRYDIAAAVDEMDRRGIRPLFLFGHSMGSNRVLYYLAATEDPRIAGVVLTGPPGNLYAWNVKVFGEEAAKGVLQRAQELKAKGKGNEWMPINLGPLGKTLYTANHLVSLRGPDTFSDPFKNIARVSRPILIVHGLADRLADPKISDRLRRHAAPGTSIQVVKIPDAGHGFRSHKQNLVESIQSWLHKKLSVVHK